MRKLIRISEVMRLTKYDKTSIHVFRNKNKFPKPFKLTRPRKTASNNDTRTAVWLESEILEWLKNHIKRTSPLPDLIEKWNDTHDEQLLLTFDLISNISVSESQIINMISTGVFPNSIKMPSSIKRQLQDKRNHKCRIWLESDVEAWIDERIAERDKD